MDRQPPVGPLAEIALLDLNPVLDFPPEVGAVDANLRLVPRGAEPDPTLPLYKPA